MAEAITRLRARILGQVQGVGFRPFVRNLAQTLELGGWVGNDAQGVVLEIEGRRCGDFLDALLQAPPRLARIERIETRTLECLGSRHFEIAASMGEGPATAVLPADIAVCEDCLAEMFDPADRRHRYAFVNCTQCGPRFSITHALPYDRAHTTMAGFALCAGCAAEYADPGDRRYHAQPLACPRCGPQLDVGVDGIAARLLGGEIVALKGLGGYHLLCDARNAQSVAVLRQRKQRDGKPFAVMVANIATARGMATMSAAEEALLCSPARPVVVVHAPQSGLPEEVAAGLPTIGLMLPYLPLHELIFHAAAGQPAGPEWRHTPQRLALVMTSANPSGEPLISDDDVARKRLPQLADIVVGHNRPIAMRCDDSVARVVAGAPLLLRRARGHVPQPIALAEDGPTVLGVGALMKCAPCLLLGGEAVFAQHIGEVNNSATYAFLGEAIAHLCGLLRTEPTAVACDLHPDYLTSRYARESGLPVIMVQHHHAHLAAIAAEFGIRDRLSGWLLDGFGLGSDGTLWGGELLAMDGTGMQRLGHLAPLPLPGGDRAAREPWRMASAVLHALGRSDEIERRFHDQPGARDVAALLVSQAHALPVSSACGRLFDAAAALLGVRTHNRFEAEAAMALEMLCRRPRVLDGGWHCRDGVLDFAPLFEALLDTDPVTGAELFHGTLAAGLAELALATLGDQRRFAVGGGCVANRPLVEALSAQLEQAGVRVLLPRQAPPGDGGLALGQALIARRMLEAGV